MKHSLLRDAGALDKQTVRNFDLASVSAPREFTPREIRQLRDRHHVSRSLFACLLNTDVSALQRWETGTRRPTGATLKLLSVVQKHGLKVLT
jgi:putative transcriptional regulator